LDGAIVCPDAKHNSAILSRRAVHLLILAFLASLLFFYNLGGWDLWEPDEPRYAQVAREMLEDGNWILPRLNNRIYPDKPPVFFWLIAISYAIFGEVNSLSARFPSALAGVLSVLMTYLMGSALKRPRAGFISALVLATTIEFFWLARRANIDMTLTLFITTALFFFYKGYRDESPRLYYFLYLFMGLATLTKGPVGFILPLLTVITYLAAKMDGVGVKKVLFHPGLLLFFILILSWFVPCAITGGREYLDEIILNQMLGRVYDSWSHKEPFYYYFLSFPPLLMPWIFFLPGAFVYGFSKRRQSAGEDMLFPTIWFIAVFIFFSLCSGKRTLYLLPLLPAFALMVGLVWNRFFDKEGEGAVSGLVRIPCYLLLFSLIAACILLPWLSTFFKSEHRNFNFFTPALVLILSGIAALIMCVQRKAALTLAMLMTIMAGGFFYAAQCVFPALNQFNSMKPFSMQIKSLVQKDDLLVSFCEENASFIFYSGIREIKELETPSDLTTVIMNSPRRVFCLIYKKDFDKIVPFIPLRMFRWYEGKADDHEILLISNRERS
jgi:4-amino-4-deoxy-L-arabinose transferase-like glycosyltransferase